MVNATLETDVFVMKDGPEVHVTCHPQKKQGNASLNAMVSIVERTDVEDIVEFARGVNHVKVECAYALPNVKGSFVEMTDVGPTVGCA